MKLVKLSVKSTINNAQSSYIIVYTSVPNEWKSRVAIWLYSKIKMLNKNIIEELAEHYCLFNVQNKIYEKKNRFSSVQFSHSFVFDSLRPHELQSARPPCPSPTPGVHSDWGPLSRWCHPAISSSVVPFSSCPQSLPASEYFPMSQLFLWGGQSTGVSALGSFLPKNTQGWSPLEWTGSIFLQSKGL